MRLKPSAAEAHSSSSGCAQNGQALRWAAVARENRRRQDGQQLRVMTTLSIEARITDCSPHPRPLRTADLDPSRNGRALRSDQHVPLAVPSPGRCPMTPERTAAYRRVIQTIEELGPSKLLGDEQDRLRTAADSLLCTQDPGPDAAA